MTTSEPTDEERRLVKAEEKRVRQQDAEQAMEQHLAEVERQRQNSSRLRELRLAKEAADEAARDKEPAVKKRTRKPAKTVR